MTILDAEAFLKKADDLPIVDVRSPQEYEDGHVPGALNIPLFSNEERKKVGTLYKQQGKRIAVIKGLELVGPKLAVFVKQAQKISPDKKVLLHCWRGGMRSKNMAWLFELAGFEVYVLQGGYKAYRAFIRAAFSSHNNFVILGGKTGSGKSEILEIMQQHGEQVLDLEGIAHHKGSAFGDLGQEPQPTNEQFENNLYRAWAKLNPEQITWLEDESRGIGKDSIPEPFFLIMREAEVVFIDVPKDGREDRLVIEYGCFTADELNNAIQRISKRLGGLNTKLALEAIEKGDLKQAASILLLYYDKAYLKGLNNRDPQKVFHCKVPDASPKKNVKRVLDFYKNSLASKPLTSNFKL